MASKPKKQRDAWSEKQFADKLVEEHANRLRFCNAFNWMHYDGRHWERDQLDRVTELAKRLVSGRANYETNSKIRGIVSLAASDSRIRVMADAFDANPWWFNVGNGTLDLLTGEPFPHTHNDLITKLAGADYDPNALCPRFELFMHEIFDGDEELVKFVQRAFGYSLCGDSREQCLFLLHGTGANGKSVLLQTLQNVFGSYASVADASTFMVKRGDGPRNDVARLAGARMVCSVETEEGQRLAESLVKQLTGGDVVTARLLYREHFEFRPAFKLWLAANHKPEIRGQDYAIWRRVNLVPFNVTFEGAAADRELSNKLAAEASGILNWCLEGFRRWREIGLDPPQVVQAATAEYRSDSDVLAEFLEQKCKLTPRSETRFAALYKAYADWCEESGDPKSKISRKRFAQRLTDRGIGERRTNRDRLRVGIELIDANLWVEE